MTIRTKTIVIALFVISLFVIGSGLYFLYSFFSSFAPPKVAITKDYISTNRDFIDGVTIEKILVDSIGGENYPVKYTVTYWTSCGIDHPNDRPPNPPGKAYFKKKVNIGVPGNMLICLLFTKVYHDTQPPKQIDYFRRPYTVHNKSNPHLLPKAFVLPTREVIRSETPILHLTLRKTMYNEEEVQPGFFRKFTH